MRYENESKCPVCGNVHKIIHVSSSRYEASMQKTCETCGTKLQTKVEDDKAVLVIKKDEE